MSEEVEQDAQGAAEEAVADFLFGKDDDYEPNPEPVAEGDDESEDEEESEETAEELAEAEYVEVEYDGKVYEVPQELKDALLRQQDYTQKTQEVAEARKAADVRLGELDLARKSFEFAEKIQPKVLEVEQQKAVAAQYNQYLRDNLDSLSSVEIEKIRLAISDANEKATQISNEIQKEHGEYQQAQQQSLQELLKQGTEILKRKIPDWNAETQGKLREYGESLGITEDELNSLVNPVYIETLWKAQQYDNLQANKVSAIKKVKDTPSIKKTARQPMPDDVKRKLNLRKQLKAQNKSATEKASLIGEDIASRFF